MGYIKTIKEIFQQLPNVGLCAS